MRGQHRRQETMFGNAPPDARMPQRHPLWPIQATVDRALAALAAEFETLHCTPAAHRFHRRICCATRCCRSSTRCAPSARWSSSSTTICCSAGSSDCPWTTRSGITRLSPRAGNSLCRVGGTGVFMTIPLDCSVPNRTSCCTAVGKVLACYSWNTSRVSRKLVDDSNSKGLNRHQRGVLFCCHCRGRGQKGVGSG